jgi:hypothetical protein
VGQVLLERLAARVGVRCPHLRGGAALGRQGAHGSGRSQGPSSYL